ncbi:hypothetical protein G9A89_009032 [Geosiphon pyriformis]|nr:hypothetical protein G9A89_009032 [Geosiphon pyriformis]
MAEYRPLNVKDISSYLGRLKVQFSDLPEVYKRFLDIMKDFKNQTTGTPGIIELVARMAKYWKPVIDVVSTVILVSYVCPLLFVAGVYIMGFRRGGIAPGSLAAMFMSSYDGNVPSHSICAVLQSIGAGDMGKIIIWGLFGLAGLAYKYQKTRFINLINHIVIYFIHSM